MREYSRPCSLCIWCFPHIWYSVAGKCEGRRNGVFGLLGAAQPCDQCHFLTVNTLKISKSASIMSFRPSTNICPERSHHYWTLVWLYTAGINVWPRCVSFDYLWSFLCSGHWRNFLWLSCFTEWYWTQI